MRIQQLNNNEKMPEPEEQTKNSKLSGMSVSVRTFYNNHFPTDRKTYNWRVPFMGLILSILTSHCVIKIFFERYLFGEDLNLMPVYCYIIIAAAVGYELHYGLEIGDRKQYTPWVVIKFIELCFTFAGIISVWVDSPYWLGYCIGLNVYCLILLCLNGLLTWMIASASISQFRGHGRKTNVDEPVIASYGDVS